jgi:hypothetical protein
VAFEYEDALRRILPPAPKAGAEATMFVGLFIQESDGKTMRLVSTVPFDEVPIGFARKLRDTARAFGHSFWKKIKKPFEWREHGTRP